MAKVGHKAQPSQVKTHPPAPAPLRTGQDSGIVTGRMPNDGSHVREVAKGADRYARPRNAVHPPEGSRCLEASLQSRDTYIPCGNLAVYVIKNRNRDPNPYPMCAACADHNVRNRGARYVTNDETFILAVPAEDQSNWFPANEDELLEWAYKAATRLQERLDAWAQPMIASRRTAGELAHLYVTLRDVNEALTGPLNWLGKEVQELNIARIPAAFEAEKIKSFTTTAGHRVTVNNKLYAAIQKDRREEAYEWLRSHKLDALIVETVNAGTLSAAAKAELEAGRELPESLFNVHYAQSTSVTKTK